MSYVNNAKAAINNMNKALTEENNELANEIHSTLPIVPETSRAFALTFVIDRTLLGADLTIMAKVRESLAPLIDMLGGESFIYTEANTTRFQSMDLIMLEDVDTAIAPNVLLVNEETNHLHNESLPPEMGVPQTLKTDDPFLSLEQFQSTQRQGGIRPSVVCFVTNDPVKSVKFLRNATRTRRGLMTLVTAVPEGVKTGSVVVVGDDLNSHYTFNIFLRGLQNALRNDQNPEKYVTGF